MQLPLIAGFGGINCAGRSSGYQAFRRLVFEHLHQQQQKQAIDSLAALMGMKGEYTSQDILDNTLVRQLPEQWKAQYRNVAHNKVTIAQDSVEVTMSNRNLPKPLPSHWQIQKQDNQHTRILIRGEQSALLCSQLKTGEHAAGSLPTGFEPSMLYSSRNHPRSVQMALFALSDCLFNSGLDWRQIQKQIPPDRISVYAGSSFGQHDDNGIGGLLKSLALGKRPTAKQIPLGYAQCSADFANAYVLGNAGSTGAMLGACASFLYNLRQGCLDIQSARCDIALIGANEAPLIPELMAGFLTMNALCSDSALRKLDNVAEDQMPDFRRACRPFGNNAGFVMAESAQYIILCSAQLAAQLGAHVYGSVADVFVNADGFKKSISSTGIGNYITLAKAAGTLQAILGQQGLHNSYVHSHGTGTPYNRVTESHILSEIARAYAIPQWNITAIKGQIGHSQGAAAADQLIAAIGGWQHDIIPGIETTHELADDVQQRNLSFVLRARKKKTQAALLNAKGFGGNNATAVILSDTASDVAMRKTLGKKHYLAWHEKRQKTQQRIHDYNSAADKGRFSVNYNFDYNVLQEKDLHIDNELLHIPGYPPVRLPQEHPLSKLFQ